MPQVIASEPKYILQQDILIPRDAGDYLRVEIRISEPFLSKNRDGDPVWACQLRLNGLYDKINPATGLTSFGAMMHACIGAYQLLLETVGPKGKVVALNARTSDPPGPADFSTLKQLFQFGGIK